jgi:hypothetical protein
LADNGERFEALIVTRVSTDSAGQRVSVPKLNRSGNPMTHGVGYIAEQFVEGKAAGFSGDCAKNIELLCEIRDNAVHLRCDDAALAKEVLAIGTAAVRNFVTVSQAWFGVDFSKYNFFLMPIGFVQGFEEAQALPLAPLSDESARLLTCLAELAGTATDDSPHFVTLRLDTKIVKGEGKEAIPVRWTTSENAPQIRVTEESMLLRYPYNNKSLVDAMRNRYSDFKQDKKFYRLKAPLHQDPTLSHERLLDPANKTSGRKRFYSAKCLAYFDKHYSRAVSPKRDGSVEVVGATERES